jgi:predicted amino acid racemase
LSSGNRVHDINGGNSCLYHLLRVGSLTGVYGSTCSRKVLNTQINNL